MLDDEEFKLDTLMQRPHIQILERIIRMQKMMYEVQKVVDIQYKKQLASEQLYDTMK